MLDKVYETGETFAAKEAEVKLNRFGKKDTIYVDFTFLPMRSADGEVDGVLFQGNDVTEKVLVRTRLEDRVSERTAELLNAQADLRSLNEQLLLAQEEERRRLALELHDGAGQWLVGLKWKLGSLPQLLEQSPQQIPEELNDSLKLLDSLSKNCAQYHICSIHRCWKMPVCLRLYSSTSRACASAAAWLSTYKSTRPLADCLARSRQPYFALFRKPSRMYIGTQIPTLRQYGSGPPRTTLPSRSKTKAAESRGLRLSTTQI